MSKDYRIAACIPAGDEVKTFWAYDHARMMMTTMSRRKDIKLAQMFSTGSLIPKQRNTLLKSAIEDGFTHVLFEDSDMRFPGDALIRLLDHKVPAVCLNYTKRNYPFEPTAYDIKPGYWAKYTLPESTGIERVSACGMGFMLLELDSIRKKLKEPYFMVGFNKEAGQYVGEDVYFCQQLAEHNIPLYVDHDLSKEAAHLGRFELTTEHAVKYARDNKKGPFAEQEEKSGSL